MDPNLLPPGADPSTAGLRSSPLGQPVSVKPHAFMGTSFVKETVYYFNSVPGASMHRPDGKKLPFMFNICATNIQQDINYLEAEIEEGHGYVRHATEAEVHLYKMRTDPTGTLTAELRPKIEAELREKLEAEIRERLMGEFGNFSDADKLAGVDKAGLDKNEVIQAGTGKVVISSKQDPAPKNVPLTPAQQLAALAAATQRPLITPVSTVDIAGAAAGSAATK